MINEEKRENGEATNEEGVGNFFFCVVVKKSPSLSFQSVNSVFSLKKVSLFSLRRLLLVGKKPAQ